MASPLIAAEIGTLHRALDLGANFFDTADMYGAGSNEELISAVVTERPGGDPPGHQGWHQIR